MIASGQGFCLQTAHLESGALTLFVRNSAILPNYWGREERKPHLDSVLDDSDVLTMKAGVLRDSRQSG